MIFAVVSDGLAAVVRVVFNGTKIWILVEITNKYVEEHVFEGRGGGVEF